jgi:hypothetical protein
MKKKYGGRVKGTPNVTTKELRERISRIVDATFSELELNNLNNKERIELLGKLLPYIAPRLTAITIDDQKHEQQFTPIEVKIIHPYK